MCTAGIDIGSRTVKLVLADAGRVIVEEVRWNSHDPIGVCRDLLRGREADRIVATGYGRHLFERYFDCETITEIKAVSLGARALFPGCRTILDIGGQDTKAVSLDPQGRMKKFEMNDKCAAGTGKFLEVMATALGYSMEDFVKAAKEATKARSINAMCTVFAESEVIGLMAREAPREELALGLHLAVAKRATAMLHRVEIVEEVVFCGGAAKNACLAAGIENALGLPLHVAADPQTVAAFGCTLAERQ